MVKDTLITTIKIEKGTKSRLSRLKEHEKESYEAVITKILYILNTIRKNPEKANKILKGIDRNIKNKNIYLKEYSRIKEKPEPKQISSPSNSISNSTSNPKQNLQQEKDSH